MKCVVGYVFDFVVVVKDDLIEVGDVEIFLEYVVWENVGLG